MMATLFRDTLMAFTSIGPILLTLSTQKRRFQIAFSGVGVLKVRAAQVDAGQL